MAEATDPFSTVFDALWRGIVEPANPADRLVFNAVRQRCRFDRGIEPNIVNEALGDGQTPSVLLMPGRQDIKLFAFDDDAVSMMLGHQLVYVGRSLDVTMNNRLKWYTLRALYRLGPVLGLRGLVPEPVKIRQAGDDVGSRFARGDARVVTIWSIDVPVIIGADDVLAGTFPTT